MEKKVLFLSKDQAERIKDYAVTFSTNEGKRVLEDLKNEYFRECYVRGDIWETFKRTCCRDLISEIEYMIGRAGMPIEIIKEEEE